MSLKKKPLENDKYGNAKEYGPDGTLLEKDQYGNVIEYNK